MNQYERELTEENERLRDQIGEIDNIKQTLRLIMSVLVSPDDLCRDIYDEWTSDDIISIIEGCLTKPRKVYTSWTAYLDSQDIDIERLLKLQEQAGRTR